ncbi:basic leucine zipper 6-like [Bidens hawaiensis]|uniref:basic leucine zipper 6-like n=1 Tax=Bidens hawaiensis TaxID=980011 RepID=UPI00404B092C
MAQLPPKVPALSNNWPSFSYQITSISPSSASQQPNWVDEFHDFSSMKRNSHRRSTSDPIAFIESNNTGFERLDDEQFSSMFSDNIINDLPSTRSSSNPSSPSDQNSDNDTQPQPSEQQPKNEPETESEKACFNFSGDPKRVKRILANRQSAQRSRVRKLQYISELERSFTSLQTEVSVLSPRVAFLDHQRLVLNVDNSALKQRIAALAQDKIFKDAHQEALKKEIERLRKVYQEQNKMQQASKVEGEEENAAVR